MSWKENLWPPCSFTYTCVVKENNVKYFLTFIFQQQINKNKHIIIFLFSKLNFSLAKQIPRLGPEDSLPKS